MSSSDELRLVRNVPAEAGGRSRRTRSVFLLASVSALCGVGLAAAAVTLIKAFGGAGVPQLVGAARPAPERKKVVSAPVQTPPGTLLPSTSQPASLPAGQPPAASSGEPASANGSNDRPAAPTAAMPTPADKGPAPAGPRQPKAGPDKPGGPDNGTRKQARTAPPAVAPGVAKPAEAGTPRLPSRVSSTSVSPAARARRESTVRSAAQVDAPSGLTRAAVPAGSAPNVRAYTFAPDAGTRDPSGARIVQVEVPRIR